VQNAVAPRHLGQATGSSIFFRQIGGTVGVAVMGTVLAGVLAASLSSLPAFDPGNSGEPGRAIRAESDRQYALAERALASRDLGALYSLMDDRRLPMETKKRLITGALAGGEGARQALAAIREQLRLRADKAEAAAARVVREAFARAVTRIFFYAIFAALAAVAITLFLPELPLRRGPPAAGV
jgi:hypothetical protein